VAERLVGRRGCSTGNGLKHLRRRPQQLHRSEQPSHRRRPGAELWPELEAATGPDAEVAAPAGDGRAPCGGFLGGGNDRGAGAGEEEKPRTEVEDKLIDKATEKEREEEVSPRGWPI
jgi:hypothetical protein